MSRSLDIRVGARVVAAILAIACASLLSATAAAGKGHHTLRDIDGDGAPNGRDRNVDGDGLVNAHDPDIDGDRVPNGRDPDMDGDGVPNARDRDIDGDGAPNSRDSDMDCDRVPNRFDPDIDGDGIRNYRDPDSDADGRSEDGSLPRRVRLPKTFFGMAAPNAYAADGPARLALLREIARTGIGTLRQTFEWSHIETEPGVYDFRVYDSFVGDAARSGLTILPVLFDPPAFRSARPEAGAERGTYPPRSAEDFGAFAVALIGRYGPRGSFWAEHPGARRRPIRAWQVWNEPHLRAYWPTGPDPAPTRRC